MGATAQNVGRPLWFRRYKTKTILAFSAAALVIVIGLAVGLGVGLTRGRDNSNDDDDNSDDGAPVPHPTSKWQPSAGEAWQVVLKKTISSPSPSSSSSSSSSSSAAAAAAAVASAIMPPNVSILDIDLFDTPSHALAPLRASGVKIICYFSAGSREDWRPDKDRFASSDLGKPLDGWPGERWVNVSSEGVRDVMRGRIRRAADKGCDAIDPDNVDGYQNDNGLNLTPEASKSYIHFLSTEASKYNMSTGLKNAASLIDDVLRDVAFSVNEQCVEFAECDKFAPFIRAGKPVFHIEYPKKNKDEDKAEREICSREGKAAGSEGFSTVMKSLALDGEVVYCGGERFKTKTDN